MLVQRICMLEMCVHRLVVCNSLELEKNTLRYVPKANTEQPKMIYEWMRERSFRLGRNGQNTSHMGMSKIARVFFVVNFCALSLCTPQEEKKLSKQCILLIKKEERKKEKGKSLKKIAIFKIILDLKTTILSH